MSEHHQNYLQTLVAWFEQRLAAVAARRLDRDPTPADVRARALAQTLHRFERDDALSPVLLRRLESSGLSRFEALTVALVGCAHVDGHLAELAAEAQPMSPGAYISPWLALQAFAETRPERLRLASAFEAGGRLDRSGLVTLMAREHVGHNPLFHELVPAGFVPALCRGRRSVGARLAGVATASAPAVSLDALGLAERDRAGLAALLPHLARAAPLPEACHDAGGLRFPRAVGLLLIGVRGAGKSVCARALARAAGASVLEVSARRLATHSPPLISELLEAAFAQAAFFGEWLILDGVDRLFERPEHDSPIPDHSAERACRTFASLCDRHDVTVVLTADAFENLDEDVFRTIPLRHELMPPGLDVMAQVWRANVPEGVAGAAEIDWQRLSEQLPVSGRGAQVALSVALRRGEGDPGRLERHIFDVANLQLTTTVSRMAERTWVSRRLTDLFLEPRLYTAISEIVETERIREAVLHDWGLGDKLKKGLGLVCLFNGEPGTGKTLSAEVIASELGLPLYTVSIPHVVSKYVGETEKNLRSVFEDAAKSRCLILFDEADTLFAKRTEVQSAVSRYANMEVGLLLQLIEGYRGLVVLTTNLKDAIDPAFNRRFTHKLEFSLPTQEIRRRIWEHLTPRDHTEPDVDFEALSTLEVSGGIIRSCVLRAAYAAAAKRRRVGHEDLAEAARQELRSQGKLVRADQGANSRW